MITAGREPRVLREIIKKTFDLVIDSVTVSRPSGVSEIFPK